MFFGKTWYIRDTKYYFFDIIKIPATQIQRKCVKLKFCDESNLFVTIPLLHSNN